MLAPRYEYEAVRSSAPFEARMGIMSALPLPTFPPGLTPDLDDTDDADTDADRFRLGGSIGVHIKDESSSPSTPDSNNSDVPSTSIRTDDNYHGGPLSLPLSVPDAKPAQCPFSTVARRSVAAKQVRETASFSLIHRPSMHSSLLRGKQINPKTVKDWEPWKPILEELYMRQNYILKDVMDVMSYQYQFKATAKMYKGQFARWNWFKYAVKRRPKDHLAKLPGKGKPRDPSVAISSNHDVIESMLSPMFFENHESRVMHTGLTAVRHFLHGFVEAEPGTLKQDVVFLFDDPCYRYFKASMDLFGANENAEGGQVLRLAFLQIDRKIQAPNIKTFSDLCFLVPHLLQECGRPEILSLYLRYLARHAALRYGDHPFTALVASFAELLGHGGQEGLPRYIQKLSQINADTVGSLRDTLERTRTWARNQHLAVERAGSSHYHTMPRLEAQSVYWAQHLLVRNPESDHLAEQWLSRNFEPDFAVRGQAVLEAAQQMIAAGTVPAEYAQMIECLYVGWMSDYYESVRDWPAMTEWGLRGLELASNDQFVIWSIHLERLIRQHGSAEQADRLRERRRQHVWLESVRLQVDEMDLDES